MTAILVAAIVFATCIGAYFLSFGETPWRSFLAPTEEATGLGSGFKGGMGVLNYLLVSDGSIPLLGLLCLVAWYVRRLQSSNEPGQIHLSGFLLIAGLIAWAAWVLRSPIAHIRYLWPAFPFIWLATILLILPHLQRVRNSSTLIAFHFVLISFCVFQGLFNVRTLAVSEAQTVVYQFTRPAPLESPLQNFVARRDQDAMAIAVGRLPESAEIFAINVPASYPLTYVSGRAIKILREANTFTGKEFLILLPANRNIWIPSSELSVWIQQNTQLLERHGEYSLHAIRWGATPISKD